LYEGSMREAKGFPMHTYHLIVKAGNSKTGMVATSYSSASTCSDNCPFKYSENDEPHRIGKSPCYACNGPMAIFWLKSGVTNKKGVMIRRFSDLSVDISEFCHRISLLPANTTLRLNSAGDLPGTDGWLCKEDCIKIAHTCVDAKVNAFGYCHYDCTSDTEKAAHNRGIIAQMNCLGVKLNVSVSNIIDMQTTLSYGLPVVGVVPSTMTQSVKGACYCPAQTHNGVTCDSCRLCAKSDRPKAVLLKAHGTQTKLTDNRIGDGWKQ
jgi:hypothetical protein